MGLVDIDSYYKIRSTDYLDIKCDYCNKIYKKQKKSWYYTAYRKNVGIDFNCKNYCSRECFNNSARIVERKNFNCLECKKEFIKAANENPKFCSHSCSAIFNNNKRDGNKIVNCIDCSIDFKIWKCIDQKIYRCKDCIEKNKSKLTERRKNKKETDIKILICSYCNKSYQTESKTTKYCSHKCKKLNSKKYQYTCKNCNIAYFSSEKKSKYCSNSCKSRNLNLHNFAHNSHNKKFSRSKMEKYIEYNLILDFPNIQILFNDKETLGSELDIYFPDLKLAIELNGIFHYMPIYGKDRLEKIQNRDKNKSLLCYEKGIELLVINTGNKGFTIKRGAINYNIIKTFVKERLGRIS